LKEKVKEDEEHSARMVICWKKRRKRSKTKQVVSRVFNAHDNNEFYWLRVDSRDIRDGASCDK
jgi:hypothetical protein